MKDNIKIVANYTHFLYNGKRFNIEKVLTSDGVVPFLTLELIDKYNGDILIHSGNCDYFLYEIDLPFQKTDKL